MPPKSAAERQRMHRAKVKENSAMFEAARAKDSLRKKRRRSEMDDEEAADFKKRATMATRKWRVNKSSSFATPLSAIENELPYKSLSSFRKARRRVKNALPKSPRKKAALVRKLASDILNIEVKGPSSVTTADYSCVTNF